MFNHGKLRKFYNILVMVIDQFFIKTMRLSFENMGNSLTIWKTGWKIGTFVRRKMDTPTRNYKTFKIHLN